MEDMDGIARAQPFDRDRAVGRVDQGSCKIADEFRG